MYSLKPYHDFSSQIVLPTCMYNLEATCDVKVLQEDSAAAVAAIPEKGDKLEKLLEQQNALLEKLQLLQDKVATELTQQATNSCTKAISEVVICMDPSNPSSSILLAQSILSSIHPILISCFTHSSVRCSDRLKVQINPSVNSYDRNKFKFGITYIWKKAPHLPILLLHPSHHIPIMGESNIIKFLFSLISGNHGNSTNDVVMATIVDDLIDAIEAFKITGSPSLESILETIEKAIPPPAPNTPSPSLLGADHIGAVDVVLWCAIKSSSISSKSLPKKLQGWYEQFAKKYAGKNAF